MGKSIIDLSSVTTIGGHDKIGATAYANLDKKGTLESEDDPRFMRLGRKLTFPLSRA